MRQTLVAVSVVLLICLCLVVGAELYLLVPPTLARISLSGTPTLPLAQSSPVALPTVAATSTPQPSTDELDYLSSLAIPRDNPLDLVPRLKKISGAFATPTAPTIHQVGDEMTFWVTRNITGTYALITATLRYETPHSYLWVENGETADAGGLKLAGDTFENKIYPTDREYFGSEWTPGIDADPHVYILNTYFQGAVGYFSPEDEYPAYVNRYSNQHELFYMNIRAEQPGSDSYASTLAHEFTHMIHWNENRREGSWITEGFGDLGMRLNGYSIDHASFFQENPDVQLNAWTTTPNQAIPHYGAAYLFLAYDLNRFGAKFLRDMISSGTHDWYTVQKALDQDAPGLKFNDIFADWVVANFIDDPALGPRYSYPDDDIKLRPSLDLSQFPAQGDATVHQYGSEYFQLDTGGRSVAFNFSGSQQVKIIPTDAHAGKMMWWSNRVDQSDTSLTRAFDLTGQTRATLKFWTWFDVEPNFDYAYVEVSADGGQTWDTLPGKYTTAANPNGANYGNGYTCKSGSGCDENGPSAQWVQEQMDLTPYAGKKILLRFEYVTDEIYSGPGFALQDIEIPELNFIDDVQHGDNGWQAQGFARIDNTLPQRFILQAIEFGSRTRVEQIPLDPSNHAAFSTASLGPDVTRVVIAVSGDTPFTWETAGFSYQVR